GGGPGGMAEFLAKGGGELKDLRFGGFDRGKTATYASRFVPPPGPPGKKADKEDGRRHLLFRGWDMNARRAAPGMPDLAMRGRRGGRELRSGASELPPLYVREYAHQREPGSTPALRSDFSETLYWHPVLVLPDGKGEVSFELCDSVTTFQVTAFAHTL